MNSQGRAMLKGILGAIPGTAELSQRLIYRDRQPTAGYSLENLASALPQWIDEAQEARAASTGKSGKRILVVGFLRWWLEYAAGLGLMMYGLGHSAELAYVPYRDWLSETPEFDARRQAALIERTLSPAAHVLRTHNLASAPRIELPEGLRQGIEDLTLIDVQYSRQRETLYLENGECDADLYDLRLERNLAAARKFYALHARQPYQQVIIPNGSIFEFGSVFRTARFLGVPVTTFEFGEQRERVWLAQDQEVMLQDTRLLWEQRGGQPLTEEEERAIQDLYTARMGGRLWKNFGRQWQPSEQKGGRAVREELGLDSERPVVLLCTNVVGDSLALGRQLFTDGMVDWLALSTTFFAQHPGVQLVVRVHPGELRSVGDPSVDIIQRTLPDLPENIHVVPPDAPVNTYDLIHEADLGMVYTTTVGMEMAMAGVPVIVGARTHYRGKGFTMDPDTREQFISLLEQFAEGGAQFSVAEEQVELAWRYAYRFFFEFALPFPWHIIGFMKDIKERPISHVFSEEGRREYSRAARAFSGEPLQYAGMR